MSNKYVVKSLGGISYKMLMRFPRIAAIFPLILEEINIICAKYGEYDLYLGMIPGRNLWILRGISYTISGVSYPETNQKSMELGWLR